MKSLINNQNTDDNECLKWRLVRYLHPVGKKIAKKLVSASGFLVIKIEKKSESAFQKILLEDMSIYN